MTPEQIAIATTCTLNGMTHEAIADVIGVHRTTVSRNLERPEIKARIEQAGKHIIDRGLKPAVRTLCRLAAIGNTKTGDKDMLKLSLDASKHITSMAGLSGGAPGTVINAMIQINQAPEAEQAVNLLGEFLQSKLSTKSMPAIQDVNTIDCQAGESTIETVKKSDSRGNHTGVALSRTTTPIDVTPEPITLPGPVEGTPGRPVDNSQV